MLKITVWKKLFQSEQIKLLERPLQANDNDFRSRVQKIIRSVRLDGDEALKRFTQQYDGVWLEHLQVGMDEFKSARKQIKNSTLKAMMQAIKRIAIFHNKRMPIDIRVETSPGIVCETQARPIQRVGLYIPGGSAPLVSTVLMLGVPAQIADCPIRVLCSPP